MTEKHTADQADDAMVTWLAKVSGALNLPQEIVEQHRDALLDMVAGIAHGPSRPAAPLTAFLVGLFVGASDDKDGAVIVSLDVVNALLRDEKA